MTIGSTLRALRQQQGVSQESLARRAGTSQAAVSDIERGRVSPTFETAERLLLCLGHRLHVEAVPLPMDADLDSLRDLQQLTPRRRLQRMSEAAAFLRTHSLHAAGSHALHHRPRTPEEEREPDE